MTSAQPRRRCTCIPERPKSIERLLAESGRPLRPPPSSCPSPAPWRPRRCAGEHLQRPCCRGRTITSTMKPARSCGTYLASGAPPRPNAGTHKQPEFISSKCDGTLCIVAEDPRLRRDLRTQDHYEGADLVEPKALISLPLSRLSRMRDRDGGAASSSSVAGVRRLVNCVSVRHSHQELMR